MLTAVSRACSPYSIALTSWVALALELVGLDQLEVVLGLLGLPPVDLGEEAADLGRGERGSTGLTVDAVAFGKWSGHRITIVRAWHDRAKGG